MKVIFERVKLNSALAPLMGSVSTKNTMSATEGILIETEGSDRCVLSAFDLEKGVRLKVECNVVEPGSYVIKADKLASIVRTVSSDEIILEVDKKNITKITSGKAGYELHAIKGEEFPNMPELNNKDGIDIKKDDFRLLINSTLYAVAQNDTHKELNGEFFTFEDKMLTVVSCDSNRLAYIVKECDMEGEYQPENYSFILPGKSVNELIKLIAMTDAEKIHLRTSLRYAIFKLGDVYFFTKMIDATYLDYRRFFPSNFAITVKANVSELMSSLERALLVTEDKSMGASRSNLRCKFAENTLKLSSVSLNGSFADELEIEKEGGDIEIGFNCRYFLDAVKACTTDEIYLKMNTPLMSMIIEPANDCSEKFIHLVLPIKLKD